MLIVNNKGVEGDLTFCKADSELLSLLCVESHVVGNCPLVYLIHLFMQSRRSTCRSDNLEDGAIVDILINRKGGRQVVDHDQEKQGAKLGPLWYPGIDGLPAGFYLTKLDTLEPVLKEVRTPLIKNQAFAFLL